MDVRLGLQGGLDALGGDDDELYDEEYLNLAGLIHAYVTTQLQSSPRMAADYICLVLHRNGKNRRVVRVLLTQLVLASECANDDLLGRLTDELTPMPVRWVLWVTCRRVVVECLVLEGVG